MPGYSGVTVVTMLVCFFYFACEAAGALSARHSLRPLKFQTRKSTGKTRAHARRDRGGVSHCRVVPAHAGPITTVVYWSTRHQPSCETIKGAAYGSLLSQGRRTVRGEIAEVCAIITDVIARSEATKQSNFDLAMPSDGLLRLRSQ